MKRFLFIFLVIVCLAAAFCPAFAAVECTVPKELSGGTAAPDVPMLGGGPEEAVSADAAGQGTGADGFGFPVIPVIVILAGVVLAVKLLARHTGNSATPK